ncbi:MAG: nucleoside hydrolase [Dorea sp.]
MKHIVYDCDNTFGVPRCDVDDGLALLYLLGCEEAWVHGITAAYGNNKIDVVYETIRKMLREIGREDLTLKKGGAGAGDYESEAADYLVEMADKYLGELSILATGSLTNLGGAYKKDSHFFEKVKEIVLMGGITETLTFEKKTMKELNFSCDPEASFAVLRYGKNVSVASANNCMKVLFTKEDYRRELYRTDKQIAVYIRENTDYWFGFNEEDYGIQGFYNWDVTAAAYLMHPELFEDRKKRYAFSVKDLETGFLREDDKGETVCNLPVIRDGEKFKRNIYDTWMRVEMPERREKFCGKH